MSASSDPRRPIPVAVGIIRRGSAVLMCQRPPDVPYPLRWEFPGGKVEPDEDLRSTLVRELKEELGIEVEVGGEFFRSVASYDNGSVYDVRYFLVPSFKGVPLSLTGNAVRFVPLSDLLTLDHLSGNAEILELLLR